MLKISNAVEFKKFVDLDYADYITNAEDLRKALHLALGLFHLRDWTFSEYEGNISFPFKSVGKDYQQYLEGQCSKFGVIRDIANATKHYTLDKNPSTKMVSLANVEVTVGAFQSNAFQGNAFPVSEIKAEVGPNQFEHFEQAAKDVKAMWDRLFLHYGWQ